MNRHLAYFLTAAGETLILFIILTYLESRSHDIKPAHVAMVLITNFVAAYSGFYLLPWLTSL